MGVEVVISSMIEHHAVLHTLEELQKQGKIELLFVNLLPSGGVDMRHLAELVGAHPGCLVSLMHSNNEIGTMIDIEAVAQLCQQHGAVFHCDTVQTMGYFAHNVAHTPVDFLVGAAHKFNGPKGVGFLYKRNTHKINALITGGAQERGLRGGTENIYGIVGMAKALEICYDEMEYKEKHIKNLQKYMYNALKTAIAGVSFNGDVEGNCHYTVLNVSLPPHKLGSNLLLNLGLVHQISASAGSACASGSSVGSHVLRGIGADVQRPCIRFSFGKQNTTEEIDFVVEKLRGFYA
jgi:cysteine desulfurase